MDLKNYVYGFTLSIGSGLLGVLDVLNPILETATLLIGFIIGAITLYRRLKGGKDEV